MTNPFARRVTAWTVALFPSCSNVAPIYGSAAARSARATETQPATYIERPFSWIAAVILGVLVSLTSIGAEAQAQWTLGYSGSLPGERVYGTEVFRCVLKENGEVFGLGGGSSRLPGSWARACGPFPYNDDAIRNKVVVKCQRDPQTGNVQALFADGDWVSIQAGVNLGELCEPSVWHDGWDLLPARTDNPRLRASTRGGGGVPDLTFIEAHRITKCVVAENDVIVDVQGPQGVKTWRYNYDDNAVMACGRSGHAIPKPSRRTQGGGASTPRGAPSGTSTPSEPAPSLACVKFTTTLIDNVKGRIYGEFSNSCSVCAKATFVQTLNGSPVGFHSAIDIAANSRRPYEYPYQFGSNDVRISQVARCH